MPWFHTDVIPDEDDMYYNCPGDTADDHND